MGTKWYKKVKIWNWRDRKIGVENIIHPVLCRKTCKPDDRNNIYFENLVMQCYLNWLIVVDIDFNLLYNKGIVRNKEIL